MRISVSQSRVPNVVFTRTPGNLSLESLRNVSISSNVQTGDGIFYNAVLNKWLSQSANSTITISVLDGGTY